MIVMMRKAIMTLMRKVEKKYNKAEYVQRRVGFSNVQDVLGKASIKGLLPSKAVFHQRSSSVKGRLPSKVFFCQRLSSSTLTVTVQLVRE